VAATEDRREDGPGLRRRELLAAGAAAGLTLAAPVNYAALARARRLPLAKAGKFAHGVASGFPSPKAITLWTQVANLGQTSKLTLEVAEDKGFKRVVERAQVKAEMSRDYTVHHRVTGLQPRSEYFYRFSAGSKESRVGRFRTTPPKDSKEKVRIGFFSCQRWTAGFYNAQAGLAREKDLDLVLCLGDYIYETGNSRGGPRLDTTGPNGDGDVQTLDEYREKYRLYHSDQHLQDMHAAHPFVSIWDDHEVEDNYAGVQDLDNGGDIRRVPFEERRRNAYKAFFEAMPRMRVKKEPNRIYGSARLGSVVDLFLMDQRQYRDVQPCGDAILEPCPEADDPGRTLLGATQKEWLKRSVARSKAEWKLLGSQVMLMSLDLPKGQPALVDAWDGYAAERKEILEYLIGSGVDNLVALTGDIHHFIAGDMTTTGRDDGIPAGVELVGGSATSLGLPEFLNLPSSAIYPLQPVHDPHVKYVDLDRRGYAVVTATRGDLTCEFKAVDALTDGAPPQPLKSLRVANGDPHVQVL
jgi:alkaline phosphatase D